MISSSNKKNLHSFEIYSGDEHYESLMKVVNYYGNGRRAFYSDGISGTIYNL